jgi:branched-chain amino acid transport system substrate-binding protein
MVVMAAATSAITEASPFVVRTSFTLPQASVGMAEWANKNGIKKTVTLVADYGPGFDAEKFFADRVTLNGGQVMDKLRTPLRAPDFAPMLQKVRDAKPDALFVFLPSGQGAAFMKQFIERGLDKSGHPADRHRRRHRRRPAGRHGRRGAGRHQFAPLLGRAPERR